MLFSLEFWGGDFVGNGSSMQDLQHILEIIQYVLQYPFPVFGFYVTLEGTLIGGEVIALAWVSLMGVFE